MFRLPLLAKKVIYLDQFALSHIMKALNPETDAYKRAMDPFRLTKSSRLSDLTDSVTKCDRVFMKAMSDLDVQKLLQRVQ